MKLLLIFSLMSLVSCATKYVVPGNRFITPETQGGAFRGQFEIQITKGQELTIDTSQGSIEEGVLYQEIPRTGFLYSNSFFESLDLIWSHVGSGNSMLGGKLQLIGSSRTANATGHKLALAALIGGNEHETDDESVEFNLGGQEVMLIYGYRINENVLPYAGLSRSTYKFTGIINMPGTSLNGKEPELDTTINALNGGVELSYNAFFAKIEGSYQQITTTDTKDKEGFLVGYSLGFSW
jgi:hypothetical protein